MKPMGTITKYYPFIDEDTQSVLDSLMEKSNSYYDFVQRLCEAVLENEVSVNLAYIAAAWWCRVEESKSLIQDKYKDVPCIRPWGYPHNSVERDQLLYHDAVVEAIDKVLDSSAEDWMETELHLLHTFYHWPIGDIPSYLEPLDKAMRLIDVNPLLECFKPLVYAFEGTVKVREGIREDSLVVVRMGRELAEVHNDSLYMYLNLLQEGNILRTRNVRDSLACFEVLHDLVQDLEVPYCLAEVLNDSSIAFEAAGEYDLAISCHLEKMKIFGMEDILLEPIPARVYATMGDGHNALEVIDSYFEYAEPVESPVLYLLKAWALALQNRIEEAERTLVAAHSLTIKSGAEGVLGNYYHVSGVIELERGDIPAGLELLEKAWDISERIPAGTNQNRALLDLTRAELLLDNQTIDSTKGAALGKWLCKLETFATERDLPGIRMQAALLKSEFYQNHGQLKDAHSTLQDALDITDSLGVVTLRKMIKERIQEINQLVKDEELVS
ncbi:MAG: hypothetical protein ACTSR9_18725 [Candidatus Thorarchaeota archaeon]